MFDFNLAELYGAETRALKQAVHRNPERSPDNFMFELSAYESRLLVSQTMIPSLGKLHEMEKKYDGQSRMVPDCLHLISPHLPTLTVDQCLLIGTGPDL